jgi:hypothetical protein
MISESEFLCSPVVATAIAYQSSAHSRGDTMARRFVTPPNWPQPPAGWVPPPDWQPPTAWGPPPPNWQFWVDDEEPTIYPDQSATADEPKIPRFGARKHAKKLATEAAGLRQQLDRLGAMDVAELEQRRTQLQQQIAAQERELRDQEERHRAEIARLQRERDIIKAEIVQTQDVAILQEIGIYEAHHPLTDSTAYKSELARIQDAQKSMARKDEGAVEAAKGWTVDGSAAKGRAMTNEYSKLVLRAYNAEADNLVRAMKPYRLQTSIDRLEKVARTIERLGKTMSIRISPAYHRLRILEMELTADYLDKLAEEKEREREERERLREERKAQQELEAERRRLEKERQHYENALAALIAKGDESGAAKLRQQLADIDKAIQDVDYRAANVRAGYVYVISNIGAFGEDMVKIGMTRRLEPMDRVRELGDASVPFRFDVHALFFSEDAVGIEAAMHERFADKRVNKVNMRREFFRATPAEAREALMDLAGNLISYTEVPEAVEFRQSQAATPTLPT